MPDDEVVTGGVEEDTEDVEHEDPKGTMVLLLLFLLLIAAMWVWTYYTLIERG